ncbi:DUF4135 domain-containing protein [Dolosigranulum pigrum]|nr:DUF4135 domain-containing protein [Dolosigranulum pigrum]
MIMEDTQLINKKNSFDQVIDEITTYYFQQIKIVNIFNVNTIKQQLLDEVRKLYLPALVDDINHYRLNVDESSTPEEQYMTYCRLFNREKLTELHTKYPLLDKWVHNTVERYKTNLKFLSDAIAIDYDEIVKVFNLSQEAKDNIEVMSFVGDVHHGSQAIQFKLAGKEFYLKRNGQLVLELVEKLKETIIASSQFDFPKTYLGEQYFIQEAVQQEPCQSEGDIADFYFNMGMLLSFVYMLNGSDMHNENVIASGKTPYVVDIETLINPVDFSNDSCIEQSIFQTAMLPMKYNPTFEGIVDCSSIGEVVTVRKKIFEAENPFSSRIRLKLKDVYYEDIATHLPLYDSEYHSVGSYLHKVEEGFTVGYRTIIGNKKNLINIVEQYSVAVQCRLVMRNTIVYSELLKRLNSPDLLVSISQSRQFLHHFLWDIRYITQNKQEYINEEINQLLEGEVPYFTYGNEGTILSKDVESLASIKESLLMKIEQFSEEDLSFQLDLLRVAFNIDNYNFTRLQMSHLKESVNDLIHESIYDETILTIQKDPKGNYVYNAIGLGVYEGQLGLWLTDKCFHRHISYDDVIRDIINSKDIGGINGYASLCVCQRLLGLPLSNVMIDETKIAQIDVIDGLAGLILVLYSDYRESPSKSKLTQLINLLELFEKNYNVDEINCLGFAHGISGIKIIFYIMSQLLDTTFRDNYREIDKLDNSEDYLSATWCNGLTGHLIAEYILYKISGDANHMNNVTKQLPKLVQLAYNMDDYCLCHGLFGVLDFLLTVKREGKLSSDMIRKYYELERYAYRYLDEHDVLSKDISLFTGLGGISYYLNRKESDIKSVLMFGY